MNDNLWILTSDELPISDELVEIQYQVVFEGKYINSIDKQEWFVDDNRILSTQPIAWRPLKKEKRS